MNNVWVVMSAFEDEVQVSGVYTDYDRADAAKFELDYQFKKMGLEMAKKHSSYITKMEVNS